MTEKPTHGGKREGAGRKPRLQGAVTRCYVLLPQHVERIEAYRIQHGHASASEALRAIIEETVS